MNDVVPTRNGSGLGEVMDRGVRLRKRRTPAANLAISSVAPRFYASLRAGATIAAAAGVDPGRFCLDAAERARNRPAQPRHPWRNFRDRTAMQTLYESSHVCVALRERCVVMTGEGPHACVSHAPFGGALRAARTVAIHETRNDELTLDVDPIALL